MSAALSGRISRDGGNATSRQNRWGSVLLYAACSAIVFLALGNQPILGPDHLTYFGLTDSILASCPGGNYWREASSIRTYGVILAYLHGWTGSHVLSMKIVLAVVSVLYLLAAELFFSLFTDKRWQAVLFAVLSGFAVSFGISSWGITDSTALLPRTLVAPVVMYSLWFWFRYDGHPVKYLAFAFLVLGSLLHLSTFYVAGVLGLLEVWDFVVLRRMRLDRMVAAFLGGVALSGALLLSLEYAGVSNKVITVQIPDMLRSIGFKVPYIDMQQPIGCGPKPEPESAGATAGATQAVAPAAATTSTSAPVMAANTSPMVGRVPPTATISPVIAAKAPAAAGSAATAPPARTAKEAWAIELSLRPWRNMPLPMVNVANALSSSSLILLLALAGMVVTGRNGFTRVDWLMLGMFLSVPVMAFGPQTALWILRSFTSIYPATIEEVRAISLIMIPAFYFILKLFRAVLDSGGPRRSLKAGAIVIAVIALPLFMKNLPNWAREDILSTMEALHVVDSDSSSSVANARSALGLGAAATAPLYYATVGVREWLEKMTPPHARILTDRDDLILLRDKVIVGPRQVGATTRYATTEQTELFLQVSQAMGVRDIGRVKALARSCDADYIVVPWRVDGALFVDGEFSVISVPRG